MIKLPDAPIPADLYEKMQYENNSRWNFKVAMQKD